MFLTKKTRKTLLSKIKVKIYNSAVYTMLVVYYKPHKSFGVGISNFWLC